MKFYLAKREEDGKPDLITVKGDADKYGPNTQIDVPVDKDGLRDVLMELLLRTWEAETKLAEVEKLLELANRTDVSTNDTSDIPEATAEDFANMKLRDVHNFDIDEEWEKLPLTKQLHFAALACEEARTAVPKPPVEVMISKHEILETT